MGFLGRRGGPGREHHATTTALVVEAAAPPEGGPTLGPGANGPLRILADLGSGRRLHDGKIRMTGAHWLVPGMEIEVTYDPDRPDGRFEIDWDALPTMEARAALGRPGAVGSDRRAAQGRPRTRTHARRHRQRTDRAVRAGARAGGDAARTARKGARRGPDRDDPGPAADRRRRRQRLQPRPGHVRTRQCRGAGGARSRAVAVCRLRVAVQVPGRSARAAMDALAGTCLRGRCDRRSRRHRGPLGRGPRA